MARTKTFTLESALDQALIVFRQHGYHNTSMRMISDRLGCSRSSIYATFRDKHGLFEQTLRHYGSAFRMPGAGRVARCRYAARRPAARIRVGHLRRRQPARSVSAHRHRHRTRGQVADDRGDTSDRALRPRGTLPRGYRAGPGSRTGSPPASIPSTRRAPCSGCISACASSFALVAPASPYCAPSSFRCSPCCLTSPPATSLSTSTSIPPAATSSPTSAMAPTTSFGTTPQITPGPATTSSKPPPPPTPPAQGARNRSPGGASARPSTRPQTGTGGCSAIAAEGMHRGKEDRPTSLLKSSPH